MERNSTRPTTREKVIPGQPGLFDRLDCDPVVDTQPNNSHDNDHGTAAAAVLQTQQLPGIPAVATSHDQAEAADSTDGSIHHSSAEGLSADGVPAEHGPEEREPENEPDPIPPRGAIPIRTGREAMPRRAVRLYGDIARLRGLEPMDMLAEGESILVDEKIIEELRKHYLASDEKFQKLLKECDAGETTSLRRQRRRAQDRARKEIKRAFDDLVSVYAAEEVADQETGKRIGYWIYRLPEVQRRQLGHGAESVLRLPKGGRTLVDGRGCRMGRR